ncbi:MAG: hypothetical protein IKC26_05445 [Clostridia bacterium]|nr:hypothetical protein [Clostridia bacterium]
MRKKEDARGGKKVKSGSALFMYIVIALMLVASVAAFVLYYGKYVRNGAILWVGITAFTIVYHFWGRILLGNLTKLFRIHHGQRWFRELGFEKRLYKLLRVRKWKEKVLTYDPDAYDVKKHTLEELADTMSKSEIDHWVNELLSLSTLLFALLWGEFWIFALTAALAMVFDAQFIIVQRYNRPCVLRLMARRKRRTEGC